MSDPRNVVMVTVDSLRADYCGYLNPASELTPSIDELASEGLVFENALSHGTATRGATSSFLTGDYPFERPTASSVTENIRQHLGANDTLPERLSRMGYTTAAFTANPWTSRHFFEEDMFDHFEDFLDEDSSSDHLVESKEGNNTLLDVVVRGVNWWQGQNMFMSWESFYDDVVEWQADAEEPYFLWVFLVDVHMPFLPPKEYQTTSRLLTYPANAWLFAQADTPLDGIFSSALETAYADCVRYTDEFVRRFVSDLAGDPLVFFHADHGEVVNDEGTFKHGAPDEEIVHVPLLVLNGPERRVEEVFSLRDLPELVVRLATDGDVGDVTRPYVTARTYGPKRVVRGNGWRYTKTPTEERVEEIAGPSTTGRVLFRTADDGDDVPEASEAVSELLAFCRSVVGHWAEADDERRRIVEAASGVASEEPV
jgi:arylsulfatase